MGGGLALNFIFLSSSFVDGVQFRQSHIICSIVFFYNQRGLVDEKTRALYTKEWGKQASVTESLVLFLFRCIRHAYRKRAK